MLGKLLVLLSSILCDCCVESFSCESVSDSTMDFNEKQKTILARDIGGITFFLNLGGLGFAPVSPESVGFQVQRFTDCDQLYVGYCFTGVNATSGLPIVGGLLNGIVAVTLNLAANVQCQGTVIRLYTPPDAVSVTILGITALLLTNVNCNTRIAFTQEECAAISLVANGTGFSLNIFLPDLPILGTVINAVLPNLLALTINLQRRDITRICDFGIVKGLIDTIDRLLDGPRPRPRKEQLLMLSREISADVARKKFGGMIYEDPGLLPRMVGSETDCKSYIENVRCKSIDDHSFVSRFESYGSNYDWYKSSLRTDEFVCNDRRNDCHRSKEHHGSTGEVGPDRCSPEYGHSSSENDCRYDGRREHLGQNNNREDHYLHGSSEYSDDSHYSNNGPGQRIANVLYGGHESDYGCDYESPCSRGNRNYVQRPASSSGLSPRIYNGYERQVDGCGENTFDNIITTLFKANLLCKLAFAKESYGAETGLMSNNLFDTLMQSNVGDNVVRDAVDNIYIASRYPLLEQDRVFEALQAFTQKFSAKDLFNFGDLLSSIKSEHTRDALLGGKLDILKMLGAHNLEGVYATDPRQRDHEFRPIAERDRRDDSGSLSEYTDSEETTSDDSSSADVVRRKQPEEEGTSLGTKVIYGSIAVTVIISVATAVFYFI